MPIRAENRWLYPIDWQQLSDTIRFKRANARCEHCARPHLRRVPHLGDGRWWDADAGCWRSDRGKRIKVKGGLLLATVRVTYVVLACAHLDHDPGNSASANLAALCQRCHMINDAAEHRWQRWWNAYRRRALRDLYEDPRLTRERLAQRLAVRGESGRPTRLGRALFEAAHGSTVGSFAAVPAIGDNPKAIYTSDRVTIADRDPQGHGHVGFV